MSSALAAQQVMIRLRAILDLYDDDDIAAGIKLLDEGSRASLSALAGPYAELRTRTGHVITQAEIEGWVAEAERGYEPGDFAPPPHPELGPLSGHQADGPADCRRCQMIRDNRGWLA